MNRCYDDIIDKLGDPIWFDENAVPRYCEFGPDRMDIYANEAALILIKCQGCGKRFKVGCCSSTYDIALGSEAISSCINNSYQYGDVPNTSCCIGITMMSEPIKVLEYWHKVDNEWVRDNNLEKTFEVDDEV
jgi:hypothetical protein